MTIYSIFNDLTWTDPPNHPPIHLSKGGSVSTNHKSSNRIELSRLDQILLKFLWFHIFWPTNPPTHPPKKTLTHGWGILHRFQIFKTESNYLDLFNFYWIFTDLGGPPGGVGGQVGGGGGGCGATPTHTRTCIWHHREFPMGYPNGSSHLHEIIMSIHIHVHARACVWGLPPPTHPPGGVTAKTVKFQCLDLIEIIRFCLKILYLWTLLNSSRLTLITLHTPHPPAPPPWSRRSRNLKNAIKHERIEIIEFRLKICDPWALLHTYRLDLMCRWGVSYPKWHFYVLGPKKYMFFTPATP